jgi:hypothetical protein
MSPNAGRGGGVAGSQPMSTVVHMDGAQINFGDLTPYLTYDTAKVKLFESTLISHVATGKNKFKFAYSKRKDTIRI